MSQVGEGEGEGEEASRILPSTASDQQPSSNTILSSNDNGEGKHQQHQQQHQQQQQQQEREELAQLGGEFEFSSRTLESQRKYSVDAQAMREALAEASRESHVAQSSSDLLVSHNNNAHPDGSNSSNSSQTKPKQSGLSHSHSHSHGRSLLWKGKDKQGSKSKSKSNSNVSMGMNRYGSGIGSSSGYGIHEGYSTNSISSPGGMSYEQSLRNSPPNWNRFLGAGAKYLARKSRSKGKGKGKGKTKEKSTQEGVGVVLDDDDVDDDEEEKEGMEDLLSEEFHVPELVKVVKEAEEGGGEESNENENENEQENEENLFITQTDVEVIQEYESLPDESVQELLETEDTGYTYARALMKVLKNISDETVTAYTLSLLEDFVTPSIKARTQYFATPMKDQSTDSTTYDTGTGKDKGKNKNVDLLSNRRNWQPPSRMKKTVDIRPLLRNLMSENVFIREKSSYIAAMFLYMFPTPKPILEAYVAWVCQQLRDSFRLSQHARKMQIPDNTSSESRSQTSSFAVPRRPGSAAGLRDPGCRALKPAICSLNILIRNQTALQAFEKHGGVRLLFPLVNIVSHNMQLAYEVVFCIWVVSFSLTAISKFTLTVIADLLALARSKPREKVMRVAIGAIRNALVDPSPDAQMERLRKEREKPQHPSASSSSSSSSHSGKENEQGNSNKSKEGASKENSNSSDVHVSDHEKRISEALIGLDAMKFFDSLLEEKKNLDPDMIEDVQWLHNTLSRNFRVLTTFERYTQEVATGRLVDGAVHAERFWKENVKEFERDNFAVLKQLIALLSNDDDPNTIAIACSDLGYFVQYYPNGKQVATALGAKTRVMSLLAHSDAEVQRKALLCCSKMLISNWEFVGKM